MSCLSGNSRKGGEREREREREGERERRGRGGRETQILIYDTYIHVLLHFPPPYLLTLTCHVYALSDKLYFPIQPGV